MARGAYYQPQGKQRVSRAWRDRVKFLWNAACPDTDIVTGRGFTLLAGNDLIHDGGLGGKMMRGGNFRGYRFTPQYVGPVYSVGVLVADTVQGATRNPFDADGDGVGNRLFQLRFEGSNVGNFIPFDTGGSPYFSSTTNTAPSKGLSLLGATMGVGGIAKSFLNGSFGPPVSVGSPRFLDGSHTVCIGNYNDATSSNVQPFGGGIYLAFIIAGELTTEEWADLYANPWQMLEGPELDDVLAFAGGSLTGSISETGAAADTCSATVFHAAALAEAGAAVEAPAAHAQFLTQASETGAAGDTQASTTSTTAAQADALIATDVTGTGAAILADAISEAGSVVELGGVQMQALAVGAESTAIVDSAAAGATISTSLAEASVASDSSDPAGAVVEAAIAEAASTGETQSATAHFACTASETVAAVDTSASLLAGVAAMSESAALVDTVTGGLLTFGSVSELMAAVDLWDASAGAPATDRQYPLAGQVQHYPLDGQRQTYPLEGRT